MKSPARYVVAGVFLLIASIVNYGCDWLLGVHFELFYGITDFNMLWILDLFVVPALVGFLIAVVYGFGAKWIAILVPLVQHTYAYSQFSYLADLHRLPQGAVLQPMGWWGFFVIVAMEVAMLGAIFGESVIKKTYGRRPRHLVFKQKPSSK